MADEKTIQSSSAVLLAEERLLNYIWLKPDLLDSEDYDENLFIHDVCKTIAKTIDYMTKNGVPLDALALYNEAAKIDMSVNKNTIDSIIALNDVPSDYIKDITDFLRSIKKSIKSLEYIDKARGILSSNVTLTPELIKELKDNFEQAESEVLVFDDKTGQVITLKEWGDHWIEEYKKRENGKQYFFNESVMDEMVVDGPIPGTGGLVVAGSGMGKSTFVLKLVNGFINSDIPCIFFSLEMGEISTYDRLLSSRLQIPYSEIVNPSDEETYSSILAAVEQERQNLDQNQFFRFCENATIDLNYIKKEIIKFQESIGQRYCIVVIDLITMVQDFVSARNGLGLAQTIEVAINKMNALSKELGIHYIGTAQLNRSGETTNVVDIEDINRLRPTRAQVKNSGALLERCRYVVSLFRKKFFIDQYFPDDEEAQAEDDLVEVSMLKQNNGQCKRMYESFNGECFTLTYVENASNSEDFEDE